MRTHSEPPIAASKQPRAGTGMARPELQRELRDARPAPTWRGAAAAGGKLDLPDNTDQIAIGAPTDRFTLDFVPEADAGLRADYADDYDVFLHQIAGGALTPRADLHRHRRGR